MARNNMRDIIDRELKKIKLDDDIKNDIRKGVTYRKSNRILKSIAASVAIIIFGGTTVFAGHYVLNRVLVNEEVLPELDSMQIVQINELEATPNEYGVVNKDYNDYNAIKDELGIQLLDTDWSKDNPYMQGHIMTDTKDFAIVTVNNFIIGDTSGYQLIKEENRYSYDSGEEFFSPISLTVDLILSESQMNNGWDSDYLGLYQFVENYTSAQGYSVNILEDTTEGEASENYVSDKVAIFVADGMRYSLRGRTSIDTIKSIVDTMK